MKLDEAVAQISIHMDQGFLWQPELPDPYPARLFHYTSQTGLLGIIKKGVVWATNVLYLNDSSELLYGFSEVREILIRLEINNPNHPLFIFLMRATELLDMSALLPNRDFYAFCFCERPDLLSQWRAYSSGGGYAIGFETAELSRPLITQGFSLFPVEYGRGESLQLLQADLRNLCKALERCFDEFPTDKEILLSGAVEWLKIVLVSRVSGMKHPAFAQEQEWRILVTLTSDNLCDVDFRQGRNALIPYFKANVSDVKTSKLPISEIVLGPTLHPPLAKKALDSLLKKNGFSNVSITESKIPYAPKT